MERPLVSVIITTRNEEKNIGNCLESIKKQKYPTELLEIIVVDNNSEDKTKETALKYTDKFFNKGPERSAQRNYGVEKSSGEYFIYLDADMVMNENVIDHSIEKIKSNPEIVALYITEIVTGKKFWSKVRRFERSFYDGTVIDCVRFIKKDKFLEVGGFDEKLTGPEDWDLDKKLRNIGKTVLLKTPIYHNEAEFNIRKYLSKKGYYAQNFNAYIAKWGKDDPDVSKQFGFFYRFFSVFLERGKWKKIIFHPILTLGMYLLRFLVGIKFLFR
ncbi:MAG TPA: glycosyltransferase [Candidatus Moranbacteria bacterium]|nr:glycosyltransferase [Candidatus Moranbacteria bacterium]